MYSSEKDKQYFFELLARYNEGNANVQETAFVERYLAMMEHRQGNALSGFEEQKGQIEKEIEDRLLQTIRQENAGSSTQRIVHRVHFLRKAGWWAAAAMLLLVCGLWFVVGRWSGTTRPDSQVAETLPVTDVAPGKDGAILTLADGRQVLLDSMGNGVIAEQNGSSIALNNGQLQYENSEFRSQKSESYNTLQTPRGRQFQLVLPDGSKVWLNAASSITYPTVFTANERKVKITGEAYFEVVKNKTKPFVVDVIGKQTVEVLGTHFNINSYDDEDAIKTTLLEGKVKVSTKYEVRNTTQTSVILQPGEQAAITTDHKLQTTNKINIDETMAWKNGSFSFTNAGLPAVMRQLARWYNIEVEYKGDIPSGTFSGEIDRSLTLDQVLKGLTKTRIRYSIENNNKLLILP